MTTPPPPPEFVTPSKTEADVDLDPGDLSKPMTQKRKRRSTNNRLKTTINIHT